MTCFFLQNLLPRICPLPVLILFSQSSGKGLLHGPGFGVEGCRTHVELRGQAGLGGQVKGGRRTGGGRALCSGEKPWLQTQWVSGCQDPKWGKWGETTSPLIHLTPPQPWAGPRQRICPMPFPKLGLLFPGLGLRMRP